MSEIKFKKSLFGYNKRDVNDYVKIASLEVKNKVLELEAITLEKATLVEQNAMLQHRVNINEKTNEEIARLALKEASDLIEKAKKNANMILKETLDYVRTLNDEVDGYKDQAIMFRSNVEKMSKDLLDTIDKSEVFYLISEANKENKD